MKAFNISKKITIMSVLLLVGATLLIYFVMRFFALPVMQDQVREQAKAQVLATANQLQVTLQDTASLTRSLASLAQKLDLERAPFELLMPELIDNFANASIVGGGIWPEPNAFADGVSRHSFYWARDNSSKLQLIDDYNAPEGNGYHNEGWYTVARNLKAGECAWSEAYEDPVFPVPMVTCTVAIERDNSFWGVATIDLALDGLKELFEGQNATTGGLSFAIDQSEQIVSFPDVRTQSLAMLTLQDAISQDSTLAPLAQPLKNNTPISEMPSDVISGQKSTLVLHKLEQVNWTVGMLLPDSIVQAPVQKLSNSLYFTMIPALIFFIAIFMWYSRVVLGWIKETTEQVRLLISGGTSASLEIKTMDEIGELKQSVNDYGSYLNSLLTDIGVEANNIAKEAIGLNELSQTLSSRATQQMDENNVLAAAINEMSASAQDVAQNTDNASKTADEASNLVTHGRDMVAQNGSAVEELAAALNQTSKVIDQLSDDSQQVGAVLDVIKTISGQTNLLALNAAIEAARAGDHGRGFAVVADEVRTLAAKTQDSAAEIENMIIQLQEAASSGVDVIASSQSLSKDSIDRANKALQAFENIVEAFGNINERTSLIAVTAHEQAKVTDEIQELAERIHVISEQNSQDAVKLTSLSTTSSEAAKRLSDLSKNH